MDFENIKNTKDWCGKGYTFSFQSTDEKKEFWRNCKSQKNNKMINFASNIQRI